MYQKHVYYVASHTCTHTLSLFLSLSLSLSLSLFLSLSLSLFLSFSHFLPCLVYFIVKIESSELIESCLRLLSALSLTFATRDLLLPDGM